MAAIGELAIFMWNVAGAPPKSTGAPGRISWAMVIPARTSIVWKTTAPVAAEDLHHLDHPLDAVLGEGARDDRPFRVRQDEEEPPGVGHGDLDVVVRRERRREIGDVLETVGEPDVLDEVRGCRQADLARPMVGHLH